MKQDPIREGPFAITQKMKWAEFLEEVVDLADIEKENINTAITSMTWSFQRKNPLPLTNTLGYDTMMQQIKVLKELEGAIVLVALPEPKHNCKARKIVDDNGLKVMDCHHEDTSLFGKKVCLQAKICILLY